MELQIGNKRLIYYHGRATGKEALAKRLILEKEISQSKGDSSNSRRFK